MTIFSHIDLKPYNTFAVSAYAKFLVELKYIEQIPEFVKWAKTQNLPIYLLGQGSNILITADQNRIFLRLTDQRLQILSNTATEQCLWVHAGMPWDLFVQWTLNHHLFGAVNLSFIPGTVGAAPVQNIGAYGIQLDQLVREVEFFHLNERKFITLTRNQCEFGYRTSIFKTKLKGKAIISRVLMCLSKKPFFVLSYKDLQHLQNKKDLNQQILRQTIGKIRSEKLPDPKLIPNAGSFFKNPVIQHSKAQELKKKYPQMPMFSTGAGVKIPAGWLIDKAGLKGFTMGQAAVYHKNALVLINLGNASGKDILKLANFVQQKVYQTFGIKLEPEVNII